MASILRVNTLTDASSNNSIATSFVAGGSSKLWSVNFTLASSSGAVEDSLNVASTTDNATGEATVNCSNSFINKGFASHTTAGNNGDVFNTTKHSSTTSSERTYLYRQSTGGVVDQCFSMTLHGDLA
jgi:hypothetical protein